MFIAVIPFMNSTHTKPYLECPECGKVVISLSERANTFTMKTFTCPYCKCRYRIPIWCQTVQKIVAAVISIIPLVAYAFSRAPGALDLLDLIAVLLDAGLYVCIEGVVGKWYAYREPLEKV